MTLTREQIRELAQFKDEKSCALSFYFQPAVPRNKAHKEDAILIKDLTREALRMMEEQKKKKDCARADLDRLAHLAEEFRSNGTHGKAIFACAAQNFWREYDLPPQLPATQIFVDRHFHLKPLAHLLDTHPRLGIVLLDRQRVRIFDLYRGELTERQGLYQPPPRKLRVIESTGYDAGRAQHRAEDEARQHFKAVADTVKAALQDGLFEQWVLGCQDVLRSQLDSYLHSYASQRLLGHFHADLSRITAEEIREQAERVMQVCKDHRQKTFLSEVLNQARSHARGVTGLRRVLRSLELGEVQTLLIGEKFIGHAVECSGCGHLDAHLVSHCPLCGRVTHEVVDVGEAILPRIIQRDIEFFYVKDDPEFDKVGNIAALLRFKSEQNMYRPSTPAVSAGQLKNRSIHSSRLRRFASR
jgi:peptide subunit release factor 1 (eRF1)